MPDGVFVVEPQVCSWCGELIYMGSEPAHVHHDPMRCGWIPESEPLSPSWDDEIEMHEMFCDIKIYYHERCCRRCSSELAGV